MKSVLRHSCAHADDFQTALKDTGLRASAHRIATAAARGGGWRRDEAGDLPAEPIKTRAHAHSVLSSNQPALSNLCACSRVPASPLSFPCWHHQGGLPYSRGVQLSSPRGWFVCIFSFQTSTRQMRSDQRCFCVAGLKSLMRTLDTPVLHCGAYTAREGHQVVSSRNDFN